MVVWWFPTISQVKIWNYPFEATIDWWLFRVPGCCVVFWHPDQEFLGITLEVCEIGICRSEVNLAKVRKEWSLKSTKNSKHTWKHTWFKQFETKQSETIWRFVCFLKPPKCSKISKFTSQTVCSPCISLPKSTPRWQGRSLKTLRWMRCSRNLDRRPASDPGFCCCIWVFPKMVKTPFHTPKWSFFSRKTMEIVGYHHFRKPLYRVWKTTQLYRDV